MALVLCLLGLLFVAYGVTVMMLNSGTLFFAVWYALGAAFLGAGLVVRLGLWTVMHLSLRRVLTAAVATLAVLLAGALCLALTQVGAQGEPDLDYVVVLGAQIYDDGSPSPVLRYRLDAALSYLKENPRTTCIVSGGQGPNEPYPEADGMAAYLEQHGIAADRIVRERKSVNTLENIAFSQRLMASSDSRVVIVTNNFHVYRAVGIARKAGLPNACGIAGYSTPYYLPNNLLREALGIIKDYLSGHL